MVIFLLILFYFYFTIAVNDARKHTFVFGSVGRINSLNHLYGYILILISADSCVFVGRLVYQQKNKLIIAYYVFWFQDNLTFFFI